MKRSISILTGIFLSGTVFAATLGGYSDVPSDHESARPIGYLKDAGIMTGYPDGTFGAGRILNRAELMKLLVGATEGTPDVATYSNCFPDVGTEWFAPYVCFAEKNGWVSGYPDGSFRPGNSVNVVETLKMLINSRGYAVSTAGDLAWRPRIRQPRDPVDRSIKHLRRQQPGVRITDPQDRKTNSRRFGPSFAARMFTRAVQLHGRSRFLGTLPRSTCV